jgi:hypothetical protein
VKRVHPPRPDAAQQGGTLDQLVAGQRIQAPGGRASQAVPRAADPLNEGGQTARRTDLAHQVDRTDVDAQLERRGRDQRLQLSRAEPSLDAEPPFARQAAVVRRDAVVADALGQQVRQALGHAAGVHEHQRRAPRLHVHGDLVEYVGHLFGGRDGFELALRQLERQVQLALMSLVHHRAARGARRLAALRPRTDQQARHDLDRALRRRQANAHGAMVGQLLEPLERHGQVGATLVARHRVDLVDDHGAHAPQHLAALLGRDHQVERLGRGDEKLRRLAQHAGALRGRGVARAQCGPNVGHRQPQLARHLADAGDRPFEVLGDVGGQRLQRRDVHHLGERGRFVSQGRALFGRAHQPVDADEKGREGLPRPGGRGDQGVSPFRDGRPTPLLGRRRPRREGAFEPAANGRVKGGESVHAVWRS